MDIKHILDLGSEGLPHETLGEKHFKSEDFSIFTNLSPKPPDAQTVSKRFLE